MKILVVRRDNIGDLICTTPMLAALRRHFPDAWIGVLTNTYSAAALDQNPDVDAVFAYAKAKHEGGGLATLAIWWRTLRLLMQLRAMAIDLAIAIGPSAVSLARKTAPRRLIRAGPQAGPDTVTEPVVESRHAVEIAFDHLKPLGVDGPPGPLVLCPTPMALDRARAQYGDSAELRIGLHLSARKISQRWPVEHFAALARRLNANFGASFLVFWAPGSENNPLHPGDAEKAERFATLASGLPFRLFTTHTLPDLVAGISLCDLVVCADGGAMHIAAGVGKPVVALFGQSDVWKWRPWGVPSRILQPPSLQVVDVEPEAVAIAVRELLQTPPKMSVSVANPTTP